MPLRLIAGPSAPVVDLAEAKRHLRYEADDQDLDIRDHVAGAIAELDGPHGRLGRCLVSQKWALDLDAWPLAEQILLPLPPTISIDAVKYRDGEGVLQTMAADLWRPHVGLLGLVELVEGSAWPAIATRRAAVSIEFTAGYGRPDQVPADIRAAVKILAAELFFQRAPTAQAVASAAVDRIVERHRVIGGAHG